MYCTKCGCETEQNSVFCPQCGEILFPIPVNSNKRIIYITVISVVAILILVFCFWKNAKPSKTSVERNLDLCSECDGEGKDRVDCSECDGSGIIEK